MTVKEITLQDLAVACGISWLSGAVFASSLIVSAVIAVALVGLFLYFKVKL